MSPKMNVRSLFIDYDGTMVNSVALWVNSVNEVLAHRLSSPLTKHDLSSRDLWEILRQAIGKDSQHINRYASRIWQRFARKSAQGWYLFDGVSFTLKQLRQNGFKLVLVSKRAGQAAKRTNSELKKYGIEYFFDQLHLNIRHEDYGVKLQDISSALNLEPWQVAVVSDWVADLRVAKQIGFRTIGVLSGVSDRNEFTHAKVDVIIKGLNDVQAIVL